MNCSTPKSRANLPLGLVFLSVFFMNLALSATVSGQEDTLRERLASTEAKVVAAALEQVSENPFGGHSYAPEVLKIASGNNRALATRARQILVDQLPRITSTLLEAAREGTAAEATVSLRLLARSQKGTVYKEIVELLDHAEPKRASEASRALYYLASPTVDKLMAKRLDGLSKVLNSTAQKPEQLRKLGDVLYYCGMRSLPGSFEVLCLAFESTDVNLQDYSSHLLSLNYPVEFEKTARSRWKSAEGSLRNRYLDFIIGLDRKRDRNLGIASLPDGPTREFLYALAAKHDRWCGKITAPEGAEQYVGTLDIENLKSKAKRSIQLRGENWAEFSHGITLDLPLSALLRRPYLFAISISPRPKGGHSLEYRRRNGAEIKGHVGIGNNALKTWFGRDEWKLYRAISLVDAERKVIQTTLFDAGNKATDTFTYPKWHKTSGDFHVPQVIEARTRRLLMRSVFQQRPEGAWVFNRARSFIRQGQPGGGEAYEPLATAKFSVTMTAANEESPNTAPSRDH